MQPLPLFPTFRLGPDDGTGRRPVSGPDHKVAGHVIDDGGRVRAHTPAGYGPRRTGDLETAVDVVVLHLYEHGTDAIAATQLPYDSLLQAREDLTPLLGLRDDVIDAAARAFLFEAGRQPQVAAILAGLGLLLPELTITTTAACRRTARVLAQLPVPARELLNTHTGDAREWMLFPLAELIVHAELTQARLTATAQTPPAGFTGPLTAPYLADEMVATVRRAHHDLTDTARHLVRHTNLTESLRALAQTCKDLPSRNAARSSDSCQNTARLLRATQSAAENLPAVIARRAAEAEAFAALAAELAALAADAASRLEATAAVLSDAGRLGTVPAILNAAAQATIAEQTDGSLSVRVEGRELGPIRVTHDGLWTAARLTQPCYSPEGAIAALIASASQA